MKSHFILGNIALLSGIGCIFMNACSKLNVLKLYTFLNPFFFLTLNDGRLGGSCKTRTERFHVPSLSFQFQHLIQLKNNIEISKLILV